MSCPAKKENGAEKPVTINQTEELTVPDETVVRENYVLQTP